MPQPSRAFQWGSLLWSLALTGLIIFLAGAVLLPSTKSARINVEEWRRQQAEADAAALAESLETSTTLPATTPTTQPALEP